MSLSCCGISLSFGLVPVLFHLVWAISLSSRYLSFFACLGLFPWAISLGYFTGLFHFPLEISIE